MSLYSYTKARKKHLLQNDTKLWILFLIMTFILFYGFNYFISYKTNYYKDFSINFKTKQVTLKQQIVNMENDLDLLRYRKNFAEGIFAKNIIIKNSIKNLFDLIPDEITLQKVQVEENQLILYGSTATKEIFHFLLGAPLKSIFNYNNTFFYLTKSGRYNFVSTNRIEQDLGNEN